MSGHPFDEAYVRRLRQQFPALGRMHGDSEAVYLDGPAGTQVPQRVIDAIAKYLSTCNANHEGAFATSRESDRWVEGVHEAAADFVGAVDPGEIIFGPNMTSLTLHLSRAIANTWEPGDEIIVTRLDHDANVRPWVLAARDRDVKVHFVPIQGDDCALDQAAFESYLNDRTKLVAVGCASNSVGTINPVAEMTRKAHEVGALVFLDAVHNAPHALIDVQAWDCDFLACSAYKFFGPHIGILWGRRSLLESITPYKLNPATDDLPGRWMTGTQNFECIVGVGEAIDYMAEIGSHLSAKPESESSLNVTSDSLALMPESLIRDQGVLPLRVDGDALVFATDNPDDAEQLEKIKFIVNREVRAQRESREAIDQTILDCFGLPRRDALKIAYAGIRKYEMDLCRQLIEGLVAIDGVTLPGIKDHDRFDLRMPTLSFFHDRVKPEAIADALGDNGIFAWHGNYYAWELSRALNREPEGMVRLGLLHYNTAAEVERTLETLTKILA